MNDSPDTPGTRLVTILASDPNPGRVDRARMGRRNPADTEPRPEVPPEDIEATRAELAELRRRMARKMPSRSETQRRSGLIETEYQLSVTPTPDEELLNPEFQKVLGDILHNLEAQGFKVSSQTRVHSSADTGAMWLLGQFTIKNVKDATSVLVGIAGTYLISRAGRRIKVEISETDTGTNTTKKIEVHSINELKKVLNLIGKE